MHMKTSLSYYGRPEHSVHKDFVVHTCEGRSIVHVKTFRCILVESRSIVHVQTLCGVPFTAALI